MKNLKIKYLLRFLQRCLIAGILLFIFTQIEAQNESKVNITGKVIDAATGLPIITAQIKAKFFNSVATVNDEGVFNIEVPINEQGLIINALDYNTTEINIHDKDSLTIKMYAEFFTSNYKPVVTPNGIINSRVLNSDIQYFENNSFTTSLNVENEIQNKLAGTVYGSKRSGIEGIGSVLSIYGINSLNSNTQPLYVVDGVNWDNSLDIKAVQSGYYVNPLFTMDMADIESVSVIRNGAAIYGSKGANGVILINTHRGKNMVTKITVNGTWGVTNTPNLIPVLNAEQSKIYASEIYSDALFQGIGGLNNSFLVENKNTPSYYIYNNSTNWSKEVYRNGFAQNYSINVNGGDETALYMFSFGYTNNSGVVKNTDLERINARFNADVNFTPIISLGFNTSYSDLNRDIFSDGVDSISPTYLSIVKPTFLSPYTYTYTGELTSTKANADIFRIGNPSAIIDNTNNKSRQNNFNISITPKVKLGNNLYLKDQYSYTLINTRESLFSEQGADSIRLTEVGTVYSNEVRSQITKYNFINNDLNLSYYKEFKGNNYLNAIAGWRYISNSNIMEGGYGYGTPVNSPGLDNASYKKAYGVSNINKSVSVYSNIDYSYRNIYLASVTFDMDASSKFGNETEGGISLLGKKWGLFPALNLAWVASSEKFFNIPAVNFLKVKAFYDVTGNDDIVPFVSQPGLISKSYRSVYSGLIIGNASNKKIQWETTYRKGLGIDLLMLNEKINLSVNIFDAKTANLLVLSQYPDVLGYGNYWNNAGEMQNRGLDVSAMFKLLNTASFKWELGASIGHYKNKITSLPNEKIETPVYNATILTEVGKPAGVFYGYKTNGVYSTSTEANQANLSFYDSNNNQHFYEAGDVRFLDTDTNGIINAADKQVIGDPNPDFFGAVNSRFSYKNFTVNLLFTYSYGNDIYNYLRYKLESGSTFENQSIALENRWKTEGQITDIPRVSYGDPKGNSIFSDRWIEDGSYLKLKAITFSYKIPLKTNLISGLDVWFSVNNLFTITKYLGSDPEFSAGNSVYTRGIDIGLLPDTRSFYTGVKISL